MLRQNVGKSVSTETMKKKVIHIHYNTAKLDQKLTKLSH